MPLIRSSRPIESRERGALEARVERVAGAGPGCRAVRHARHARGWQPVPDVLVAHVGRERHDRAGAVERAQPIALTPIQPDHRHRAEAAAAMRKVVQQAGPAELPVTWASDGEGPRLRAADAGAIEVVRDEHRRPRAQQPALERRRRCRPLTSRTSGAQPSAACRSRLMSNRAVPAGSVISSRSAGSAVSDQSESAWPDCASAAGIDSRYVSTPPARRRDQVTIPMRIRRPGSFPRRARGSCASRSKRSLYKARPADMSLARSVASLPSARISRAIASVSPGGTSRTARDSRHTGSLQTPLGGHHGDSVREGCHQRPAAAARAIGVRLCHHVARLQHDRQCLRRQRARRVDPGGELGMSRDSSSRNASLSRPIRTNEVDADRLATRSRSGSSSPRVLSAYVPK